MKSEKNGLRFAVCALFAFVLLLAFAGATVEFVNVQGATQTVRQGSQATITFNVKATDFSGQFDNARLVLPTSFISGSSWSGNTETFTLLPNSEVSKSVVLSVPASVAPGTYTAQIGFSGTYNISGSNPVINPLAISIKVDPANPISLVQVTSMTTSRNGVVEVENKGSVALANVQLSKVSGDFDVQFSENGFSLSAGQKKQITVTPVNLGDVGFGGKSIVVRAQSGNDQTSLTLTATGTFCSAGEKGGKLDIRNVDINNEGEGDDDAWKLLDDVEIEVEVRNTDNDDVDDVFIELGLYDSSGDNMISDLDFENSDEEEADVGNLNDDDEETVTFRFRVPADMEEGRYKLVVKAYSDDFGESNECTETSSDLSQDTYQEIEIEREDDDGKFIAFEDVVFNPTEATCGDSVTLTTEVFNIGDEDQDQVRVNLISQELKIDQFFEIRNDLDQGDSEEVSFTFNIPQGVADKTYSLRLSSEYGYDDGDYDDSSDEDKIVPLKVLGCAVTPGGNGGTGTSGRIASISAGLESGEVTAGGEAVVVATVTNLKSTRSSFIVGASGYESWAGLNSISKRILDLAPGESEEVEISMNVKDDSFGEQSFVIEVTSDDKSETREVSIELPEKASGSSFSFGGSPYIWIIAAVNLILIILIIVVAIRISRR